MEQMAANSTHTLNGIDGTFSRALGVLYLLTLWVFSGCSQSLNLTQQGPTPRVEKLPVHESSPWEQQIGEAELLWQKSNIESYEIVVLHVHSIWSAQSHRITVRHGQVVASRAECIPAPMQMGECELQTFKASDYTVEGLFARARELAARAGGEFTRLEFDAVYGFPNLIAYDHPEVVDEDNSLRVTEFEVLD